MTKHRMTREQTTIYKTLITQTTRDRTLLKPGYELLCSMLSVSTRIIMKIFKHLWSAIPQHQNTRTTNYHPKPQKTKKDDVFISEQMYIGDIAYSFQKQSNNRRQ